MITLIKEIPSLPVLSAPYIKICCTAAAYAEYDKIALFWKQTDDNKNVTALMCLLDNCLTIYNGGADSDELRGFINMLSPRIVFTDKATANKLGLPISTLCDTLYRDPPFEFTDAAENTYEGINKAYETITERLYVGDKEAFFADMSHRVRHNCGTYVTTPLSAAFLLYCDEGSILSGIAVKEVRERSGIGSATLKRVMMLSRNKRMYVCAEKKNTPFYLKNGFNTIEECGYCTL